jgi:hypothetical protein
MSALVQIKLADEELEQLAQGGAEFGPRLAKLLDEEVTHFNEWMQQNLGGQLIPLERTALKTYLYHKIVGRVDHLERKPIPPESLLAPA